MIKRVLAETVLLKDTKSVPEVLGQYKVKDLKPLYPNTGLDKGCLGRNSIVIGYHQYQRFLVSVR